MRLRGWLAVTFLFVASGASAQSFHPGVSYPAQNGPLATATADFDGDGKPDLAVGNGASSSISIFLGEGDGSFLTGTTLTVPGNCMVASLTVGDFTGDGKPDLLAICGFQQTIWVLPGLGNGRVGPGISTQLPLLELALVGLNRRALRRQRALRGVLSATCRPR